MIKVMTPVAIKSKTVTPTTDERMMHSPMKMNKKYSALFMSTSVCMIHKSKQQPIEHKVVNFKSRQTWEVKKHKIL